MSTPPSCLFLSLPAMLFPLRLDILRSYQDKCAEISFHVTSVLLIAFPNTEHRFTALNQFAAWLWCEVFVFFVCSSIPPFFLSVKAFPLTFLERGESFTRLSLKMQRKRLGFVLVMQRKNDNSVTDMHRGRRRFFKADCNKI